MPAHPSILPICGLGYHRLVDRRLSCKHLPLPASGNCPGIADRTPSTPVIPRHTDLAGVLAHSKKRIYFGIAFLILQAKFPARSTEKTCISSNTTDPSADLNQLVEAVESRLLPAEWSPLFGPRGGLRWMESACSPQRANSKHATHPTFATLKPILSVALYASQTKRMSSVSTHPLQFRLRTIPRSVLSRRLRAKSR